MVKSLEVKECVQMVIKALKLNVTKCIQLTKVIK